MATCEPEDSEVPEFKSHVDYYDNPRQVKGKKKDDDYVDSPRPLDMPPAYPMSDMVTRPDILAEAFRELKEKKSWQKENERRKQENQRRLKEIKRRPKENERMRQDRVNLAWNYTKKGCRRLEYESWRLVAQRRQEDERWWQELERRQQENERRYQEHERLCQEGERRWQGDEHRCQGRDWKIWNCIKEYARKREGERRRREDESLRLEKQHWMEERERLSEEWKPTRNRLKTGCREEFLEKSWQQEWNRHRSRLKTEEKCRKQELLLWKFWPEERMRRRREKKHRKREKRRHQRAMSSRYTQTSNGTPSTTAESTSSLRNNMAFQHLSTSTSTLLPRPNHTSTSVSVANAAVVNSARETTLPKCARYSTHGARLCEVNCHCCGKCISNWKENDDLMLALKHVSQNGDFLLNNSEVNIPKHIADESENIPRPHGLKTDTLCVNQVFNKSSTEALERSNNFLTDVIETNGQPNADHRSIDVTSNTFSANRESAVAGNSDPVGNFANSLQTVRSKNMNICDKPYMSLVGHNVNNAAGQSTLNKMENITSCTLDDFVNLKI